MDFSTRAESKKIEKLSQLEFIENQILNFKKAIRKNILSLLGHENFGLEKKLEILRNVNKELEREMNQCEIQNEKSNHQKDIATILEKLKSRKINDEKAKTYISDILSDNDYSTGRGFTTLVSAIIFNIETISIKSASKVIYDAIRFNQERKKYKP